MVSLLQKLLEIKQPFQLSTLFSKLLYVVFLEPLRSLYLWKRVKHLHGPLKVDYGIDELIVLCVVRNGGLHIRSFIDHYVSLGVKHIVFLDNNSTDETAAIAQSHKNVTLLQVDLPFKRYKALMRRYLITHFARNRWCLSVDIDELFDYPYSNAIDLRCLIKYLNERSFNVVVAQMLDMFSGAPLRELVSNKDDSLKRKYRFYDVTNVTKVDYYINNRVSNGKIKLYFGGIRKTVFGNDVYLTKHPLLLASGRIGARFGRNSHDVRHSRVADFTCVLLHYKFLGNFPEHTRQAVREENYYKNSAEYKKYLEVLNKNPNLKIKQETSQELKEVNNLIEAQFLVVSDKYVNWVKEHALT